MPAPAIVAVPLAKAPVPRGPITAYYASTQGRRGAALLRELHEQSAQHHRPLSYAAARDALFATVEDPTRSNAVTDVYSGRVSRGVSGLPSATAHGLTAEHVWPQSEGATGVAKTDLHHTRPVLQSLNTHRSNLAYGEVVNPEWASDPVNGVDELSVVGRDASGAKVFMPRASMRGDLARDQLYFFTRYYRDQPTGFRIDNFTHSLPTLLKWNKQDPVDDAERARNEAVYQLQGNRNPFIDRPSLVDRVGFSARLVTRQLARQLDRTATPPSSP